MNKVFFAVLIGTLTISKANVPSSENPPADLDIDNVPQFVVIGFDGTTSIDNPIKKTARKSGIKIQSIGTKRVISLLNNQPFKGILYNLTGKKIVETEKELTSVHIPNNLVKGFYIFSASTKTNLYRIKV